MKLRSSVRWFAGEMERRLRANDHKGGWSGGKEDMQFCDRAKDSIEQAQHASYSLLVGTGPNPTARAVVIQEAADAANYMMFVADNAKPASGGQGRKA